MRHGPPGADQWKSQVSLLLNEQPHHFGREMIFQLSDVQLAKATRWSLRMSYLCSPSSQRELRLAPGCRGDGIRHRLAFVLGPLLHRLGGAVLLPFPLEAANMISRIGVDHQFRCPWRDEKSAILLEATVGAMPEDSAVDMSKPRHSVIARRRRPIGVPRSEP